MLHRPLCGFFGATCSLENCRHFRRHWDVLGRGLCSQAGAPTAILVILVLTSSKLLVWHLSVTLPHKLLPPPGASGALGQCLAELWACALFEYRQGACPAPPPAHFHMHRLGGSPGL